MPISGKTNRQDHIYLILKDRDEDSALSAREIHEKLLHQQGESVDLRTIRRDLIELSSTHGLTSTGENPERFFPAYDYEFKHKLHLNEEGLQVLMIALNNLKNTSHHYFDQQATKAENAIISCLNENLQEKLLESKKRYYYDYSSTGRPAQTDLKDFENIMYAIRKNYVIDCLNQSPYKDAEYNQKRRYFAVKLFVLTSNTPYLMALDQEDHKLKKLKVTRLKDVKVTKQKFNPDAITDNLELGSMFGGWGGISEKGEKVSLICDRIVATFFKENTIHNSQKIEEIGDDVYSVEMECALSSELIRIIGSFGGHIFGITPNSVHEEVLDIWQQGLNHFKKSA